METPTYLAMWFKILLKLSRRNSTGCRTFSKTEFSNFNYELFNYEFFNPPLGFMVENYSVCRDAGMDFRKARPKYLYQGLRYIGGSGCTSHELFIFTKGQLILKCPIGVFKSSKKTKQRDTFR